ncbi:MULTISPECIES: 50S ribosomal protein L16 [Caldisericum]|jgi:large subunit ribosomal protein L16|uniref:Large ribosomal subunit protein uL16 n=1 Tax=Caldisericum exile TaxID=693075 RepID=A0A2J6WDU2_9BACT|nr:MAG: 50S ribosomal protein L16 [Caldisericum exile]
MLMPERVKYRKMHRGRTKGKSKGATSVHFGEYGIQALEPGWISSRQIEACRLILISAVRKSGKLWIRIFPDKSVTKKPAETRMGGGKGDVDHWVAVVKPGRVMFEFSGVDKATAEELVKQVGYKLPVKVRMLTLEEE